MVRGVMTGTGKNTNVAPVAPQTADDLLEQAAQMESQGNIQGALNLYDQLAQTPGYPSAIVARQLAASLRLRPWPLNASARQA